MMVEIVCQQYRSITSFCDLIYSIEIEGCLKLFFLLQPTHLISRFVSDLVNIFSRIGLEIQD